MIFLINVFIILLTMLYISDLKEKLNSLRERVAVLETKIELNEDAKIVEKGEGK